MHITYLVNVVQGNHILSNLITDHSAAEAFIKKHNLVGYEPHTLMIADAAWHQVKAAIEVNNETLRNNFLAATGQLHTKDEPKHGGVIKTNILKDTDTQQKAAEAKAELRRQSVIKFQEEYRDKVKQLEQVNTELEELGELAPETLNISKQSLIDRLDYLKANIELPEFTKTGKSQTINADDSTAAKTGILPNKSPLDTASTATDTGSGTNPPQSALQKLQGKLNTKK